MVDGIYLEARLEDQAQCILVIIGATPEGKKELVGFADGVRESAESWARMSVPHDPPPTILGRAIGVAGEKIRHLGLDRSRTRALTQNFGERV